MSTTVSTTPVQLNDGTASVVHVGNTGDPGKRVTITCGTFSLLLDPGFSADIRPAGSAVSAVTASGSTTLTVDTTGVPPAPGGAVTGVLSVNGQTGAVDSLLPQWKASTAFGSGQLVVSPDGLIVQAPSGFTSGSAYDPQLWSQRSPQPVQLARWRRKLHTSPTTAKVAFPGDSTSDVTSGSYAMYQRLFALHTQAGEALAGVGSTDLYADGATTSASATFTSATAAFVSTDVGKMVVSTNIPVGARILSVESGTSVTLSANATATGTSQSFYIGRHIIGAGNNGLTLASWLATPAGSTGYNYNQLVADAPDLIVFSFGINDVRLGLSSFAALRALIVTAIEKFRVDIPGADVLLRMPNPMLTANVSSLNYVQDSVGNINTAGLAQTYSTLLRDVYLSLQGVWSNVAVADVQANVFGTQSLASSTLMADQLHPSTRTSSTGSGAGAVPRDGGYVAIADYLASVIGDKRLAFPEGLLNSRFRVELLVGGAAGAGGVDLVSKFPNDANSGQLPVTTSDTLYVAGMASPIALTGASITRPFSNSIRITGLTGLDFTNFAGKAAVITGAHAPATTGDRQIVSVDLASIAAGVVATATAAVTGARTGALHDATAVLCTPPAAFVTAGLVLQGCYPSATDTVTIVVYNPTGGAVDLAASNFAFWVVR